MASVFTPDFLQSQEFQDGQFKGISASKCRDLSESSAGLPVSANSPVTAPYIAQANDRGAIVGFNVANPGQATYTIPPHSSVPFPVNCMLGMLWIPTGLVGPGFAAGAGVTITSPTGNLTARAAASIIWAWQYQQDNWIIMGDVT